MADGGTGRARPVRRGAALAAAGALTAGLLASGAASPGAAAAVRQPGAARAGSPGNQFYTYPSRRELLRARAGDVFRWQPMTVDPALRRAASRSLRIMYRSQGLSGSPVADTGFLLVPRGRPPAGGWPVIAWGHGTTGVGTDCAPSRWPNLYPGEYPGNENLVSKLLRAGYAVVGTDYPGLGFPGMLHGYLQLAPDSQAVADSVLAARRLAPRLGRNWFAVGHSEGGQAALGAGEIASRRAPGLRFLGTVALAPASHLREMTQLISLLPPPYPPELSQIAALGAYIAVGAHLYDPAGFQYRDLLSPGLAAQMPASERLCEAALYAHMASVMPRLRRLLNPRWATNAALGRFFAQSEPAQRRSAAPILLLQGELDPAVLAVLTDDLNLELCALGDVVRYRTYPEADHESLLEAAFPAMTAWMRDRLLGRPAPQTCQAH